MFSKSSPIGVDIMNCVLRLIEFSIIKIGSVLNRLDEAEKFVALRSPLRLTAYLVLVEGC